MTTIHNQDDQEQPAASSHAYTFNRGVGPESPRFDNEITASQISNQKDNNMNILRDSVPGNKQGEGAFAE